MSSRTCDKAQYKIFLTFRYVATQMQRERQTRGELAKLYIIIFTARLYTTKYY